MMQLSLKVRNIRVHFALLAGLLGTLALSAPAQGAPLIPTRMSSAQEISPFAYADVMPQIFTLQKVTAAPKVAVRKLRALRVMATAYALTGRTATGTRTTHGSIAVDPHLIPLGTKMFVPGYGWGKAEDTGGAIRGAVIDLWMPSNRQCFQWGVRTVQIMVEQPDRHGQLQPRLLASRSGRRPRHHDRRTAKPSRGGAPSR